MQDELRPFYEFTISCDGDGANQSRVYLEYRAKEAKLDTLNTERSKFLLETLHVRFSETADIEISNLCYYTSNVGLHEKQANLKHIT